MDLDDLFITWFCVIDEGVHAIRDGTRLRTSGPRPKLADSEVLTMEVIGAYVGVEPDSALFASFRRHSAHFFPALAHMHRTTFVWQVANLHV